MNDILKILATLHRPRLLIRAARFGVSDYNRTRDLRRIIREPSVPTPEKAVNTLMAEEAKLEDIRVAGDATYSVSRHVEVLIALMAEIRLLPPGPKSV